MSGPDLTEKIDQLGATAHRIADERNNLRRALIDAECALRSAASRTERTNLLLSRELATAANHARSALGRGVAKHSECGDCPPADMPANERRCPECPWRNAQ